MKIEAIVLAAGMSVRMGKPKMILEWGNTSVIEKVIQNLKDAGISEIIVVAGALIETLKAKIETNDIRIAYNPDYQNGQMTTSLQVGLQNVNKDTTAVMIVLGDQPFLKVNTIVQMLKMYEEKHPPILMPSIYHKRGHPWIIRSEFIASLLEIQPPETLRDFFKTHEKEIHYLLVEDPGILLDMDTPEQYNQLKPDEE